MPLPRESSAFLPTVTCSACNLQVEISLMGDHLCSGAPELPPMPNAQAHFADAPHTLTPLEKYGRAPALVDTNAANAYANRGQLTPVSPFGGSRSVSPLSSGGRAVPGQSIDQLATSPAVSGDMPMRTPPLQSHRPGGYGGFQEEVDTAPRHAGDALGLRMNSIAPGPFEANRRPSAANNGFPVRKDSLEKLHSPQSAGLPMRQGSPESNGWNSMNGSSENLSFPKQPRKNGYGGFGPPSSTGGELEPSPIGPMSRSETFPKPSYSAGEPSRRPSAPGARSDTLPVTGFPTERRPSFGPDTSRLPPPRKSLIAQRGQSGSVNLAVEFGISNPYHTPSDSASSGYSTFSDQSFTSSQTSPARSHTHDKFPDASNARDPMVSLQSSMENLRPTDLRIDPTATAPRRAQSPLVESPYGTSPRGNPYDPAIQYGLGEDLSPRTHGRHMPSSRHGTPPQSNTHLDRRNDSLPGLPGTGVPPIRKGSREGQSRGNCKLCREAITGKSISSADGRLTGKYHKACFVCTTCSEPFSSAEFYVLNDKPYCEQHYHKLNGSLCGSCGRGIEGQYVEDESRVKHHMECFCCLDCRRPLSDSYFEVDGKAYCERDAMRRTQPSPNGYGGGMSGEPHMHSQGHPRGGPGPRHYGNPAGRSAPRPGYGSPTMPRGPYGGPPPTNRLGPALGLRPQMNKRMTRLGIM